MCKKILIALVLTIWTNAFVSAAKVDLSSPYATIKTHVENLEDDQYSPEKAARTLMPGSVKPDKASLKAIKLLQIYRGFGIFLDFGRIPENANHMDSSSLKHVYYVSKSHPEIYLEKVGLNWYYSQETVELIDELHSKAYPFGASKLLNIMPRFGSKMIFGLRLWQHIGILFIVLLCVIIHKLFVWIIRRILIGYFVKTGRTETAEKYISPVAKPLSILVIYPILMILVPIIQLPININNYIFLALKITWPLFATIALYRMVDVIDAYLTRIALRTDSTLDDQLVPLLRKTLKIFVLIIGVLAILSNLEIDIVPLLTGLSIGGLAFALAAQDTLKNLFGSIMIFLDRPFQVGDWITSSSVDGTVEEVGFRATRIRTFRNSVTYIPNAKLADGHIDNHGLRQFRRFYTTIGITYDTPTEVINSFVSGLRTIVKKHPHTRKDAYNIYLNDFGPSSLNIMFYVFVKAKTWPLELQYRHELIIEIMRLAETLGVRFAFPTQTLHVEEMPGKLSLTPSIDSDPKHLNTKLEDHFTNRKIQKDAHNE